MNSDRFRFFPSVYRESDLLIGVPHNAFHGDLQVLSRREQMRLYKVLADHEASYPGFTGSLEPLPLPDRDFRSSIGIGNHVPVWYSDQAPDP